MLCEHCGALKVLLRHFGLKALSVEVEIETKQEVDDD